MYEPLTDIPPRMIPKWIAENADQRKMLVTKHYSWLRRLAPEDYSQTLVLAVLRYKNGESSSLESCVQQEMGAAARNARKYEAR